MSAIRLVETSARRQLELDVRQAMAVHQEVAGRGVVPYLNQLIINSPPEPAPFRERADLWQWALVEKLAPAIEQLIGVRKDYTGPNRFWLTLPRGHDKTSLIGRLLNFALAFARKHIDCYAAAADKEQANFILDKMRTESELNPWLQPLLFFKNYQVKALRGSGLRVLSADAKSNFGLTPDLIICDELTQWPNEANWGSLMSARAKRNATLIIITNAGVKLTWQWEALQTALSMPEAWWVYEAPGPICSWMDQASLERDRKTMLPQLARQMIDNEWLDPGESAGFVTKSEAERCELEDLSVQHQAPENSKTQYIGVIDYGPVKDRTAMAVMHRRDSGLTVVDRLDILQGTKATTKTRKNQTKLAAKRVPIDKVEAWIDLQRQRFNLAALVVDPYQMEATIQKYERLLPVERFEARGGKANYELAQALRHAIINQEIGWPKTAGQIKPVAKPAHTLSDELAELVVRKLSYGYRIDHLPNRHDDRAVVLGMGLLSLLRRPKARPLEAFGEDLWW